MPSLQLLHLTEHGRNALSSRRRTLAIVTGVLVAGGTAAYVQSRRQSRTTRRKLANKNSHGESNENGPNDQNRQKRSNLKSLQVINAILLSRMGTSGLRNIMLLIMTTVGKTTPIRSDWGLLLLDVDERACLLVGHGLGHSDD